MTLITPPGYVQGGTYTALHDRMYAVTGLTQRAAALAHGALQGFYPDRFPAYSNPSGMNWTVGACAGVIANTFTTDGGDYRFCNPTNVTGSFAAASPTLNRYDILGFQVKDHFYDSSGLNQIVPAVIQGANSAGTPVDPALPSSFIPVLRAVINAAATSPTLQDLRPKTVNSMAILPVLNNTERGTLGTMPAGFTIWNIASQRHEVADGTGGWIAVPGPADAALIGGEYRQTSLQTFPAWALNKLNFQTAIVAASGITWNGSDQFTVTSSGVYNLSLFASAAFDLANNFLLGIGNAALAGAGVSNDLWTGWNGTPGGATDASVAGSRWLNVGATICAYVYINGGSSGAPKPSGLDATPNAEFSVWKSRRQP